MRDAHKIHYSPCRFNENNMLIQSRDDVMCTIKSRKDSFLSPKNLLGSSEKKVHARAPSYKEARLEKQIER